MTKTKDTLEVVEDREYRIKWWLSNDQDYGASVGEGGKLPTKTKSADLEYLEWYTAEMVCFRLYKANPDSDTFGLDSQGFWWSSKSAATKVLSQIRSETKVALQVKGSSESDWPEWAVTAKANGWEPPNGWKP
jgi:hypothetical protein